MINALVAYDSRTWFYFKSLLDTEAPVMKNMSCISKKNNHIPVHLNHKTKWVPPPQWYLSRTSQSFRRRHWRARIIQLINSRMRPHVNGIAPSRPLTHIFRTSGESYLSLGICLVEIWLWLDSSQWRMVARRAFCWGWCFWHLATATIGAAF